MTGWYQTRKVAPGVHLLYSQVGEENCYLVEGSQYAALIDTGRGIGQIRSVAESLTERPIVVLNTHGHWDHIGGNYQFEQIGIHAAEADALPNPQVPPRAREFLRRMRDEGEPCLAGLNIDDILGRPSKPTFFLEQGQVIDLGGRQLQVWHTPGHSPGSVCFLDEDERLLFCADTIMQGAIGFHMPGSNAEQMLRSYELLAQMAWEINLVLPGHGQTPLDGRLIGELADGLRRTLAGEVRVKKGISALGAARIAAFERFMFVFPPDWRPASSAEAHDRPERNK